MLEKAIRWIKNNSIAGQGIVISSHKRVSYPEVTGYFIPTLLSIGERELAYQYARWLLSVQRQDGSYGLNGHSYVFDTGQVVRGWAALLEQMPELEQPLRRACDWLLETADARTGRLMVPLPGTDWSLGRRGEVSEATHLYVLPPLRRAAELLNELRYGKFVDKSLDYYLKNVNLTEFSQPNALTHFYAYTQEALLELGCEDEARRGMASVAGFQQPTGAVPGYSDVNWVCSAGLAQLAQVWYRLGETERSDAALKFLEMLQNPSGGFFGSYGVGADYFPAEEISWTCKYAIEAAQQQIAGHFDQTVNIYQHDIAETDGRVEAVLRHLGNLDGKRVLDAGCGKGRFSAIIKRRYGQVDVTALDISSEMLRHVPPGIRTVQGGILDMPFADGEFDAAICIEALEHVVQIQEGVKELTRVLAPGGKLIIIDKNKDKLGALEMPSWEKWFGREELLGMMQANGLEAGAEFIGYDDVTQPDGLFVCWSGQKRMTECAHSSAASVNVAESYQNEWAKNKWYENFFAVMKSLSSEKEVSYHEFYWTKIYRPYYVPIVNQLFSRLPQSQYKILDCGAGYGFWSSYFSELGHQVTAVDNLSDKLRVLNELARITCNIRCENADLHSLNFGSNTFDVTFSFATLHILKDPRQGLLEMARVTKPEGHIIVCFGNPEHPLNQIYWQGSDRVKHVGSKMIKEELGGIASPLFSLSSYAHDARVVAACSDIPLYQFEVYQKKASA